MEYKRMGNDIIIRLNRGEEVLRELSAVCQREGVRLATVSGLGACDRAVIGVYHVAQRHYEQTELNCDMEIAALTGNITVKDHQPYLHCHIVLATSAGQCFGGHLNAAYISATGEIALHVISGLIGRRLDEAETGLNLLEF